MKKYVMGLDFGTLSVRAVIIDALSGAERASAVCEYPHGVMEKTLPCGTPLTEGTALEYPADYISSMQSVIARSLAEAGLSACDIGGIGVDFTACTLMAIDKDGKPMCERAEFTSDENAYAKLWKSVSANEEAEALTRTARERGERWLDIYGGYVSPEYLFSKAYQTLKASPALYESTDKFIEAGDWISFLLTGKLTRGISMAGFKALWNTEDGYPSDEYLAAVDERLCDITRTKLCGKICKSGEAAGFVSEQGARLFGLCEGTPVAAAVIDAHAGMPALGIRGTGELMMILGTSACYIVNSESAHGGRGICGYTLGATYDSLYTYEQSQRCFGDGFDRFVSGFVPESYTRAAAEKGMSIHAFLREGAERLKIGESGLLVLDWFKGNKSSLGDNDLTGLILGLRLTTTPEEIYRALLEGAAFGARMIIENYRSHGVSVSSVIASGGIALKDRLLMQIMSDVLNMPISVSDSTQACARGSAIFASVAAGIHADMYAAVDKMSCGIAKTYTPIEQNVRAYDALYSEYVRLCEYFALGGNDVMKRLMGKC